MDASTSDLAQRRQVCLDFADQRVCLGSYPTALTRSGPFWLAVGVFLLGMSGGALPTPLYPIYQAQWGFSNLTVTLVFAVYAAGVLAALLGLGSVSDRAGRKVVLLLAAGFAAASTLIFLFAQGLPELFVGRFLSGLAIGTLTGAASAAIAELEPHGDRRHASRATAMGTPGALGIGVLVAGAFVEYAAAPERLVYGVYLGALAVMVVGVLFLPETVPGASGQPLRVPAAMRTVFATAALGVFTAFIVVGLFSALAPSFLRQSLHVHNAFVAALLVATVYVAAVLAALIAGTRPIATVTVGGVVAIVAGLALVLVALSGGSLPAFFTGGLFAGFGAGALFIGTLALVNRYAPPEHRAEVVSAYFVAAYVGLTVPVIGVGLLSERVGVLTSTEWLVGLVVVLSVGVLVGVLRSVRSAEARMAAAPGTAGRGGRSEPGAGTETAERSDRDEERAA
jgi:MFS family permease